MSPTTAKGWVTTWRSATRGSSPGRVLRHLLLTGLTVHTDAALTGYEVLADDGVRARFTRRDPVTAVTLFSAPSQASATPPPRDVSMLVRVFYVNDKAQPLGEHSITACPGRPLMTDWGVQTGPSYLIDLPCTTPVPPPGDPS